jgi:hypothetical protein
MAPYGTGKAAALFHSGMGDPLSPINNASRAVRSRTAGQRYNSGTTRCMAHDLRASLVRNHRSVGHAGRDRQRAHQDARGVIRDHEKPPRRMPTMTPHFDRPLSSAVGQLRPASEQSTIGLRP